MINRDILSKLDFKKPESWLATWFGAGLLSPAPGTWGTLAGLPLGAVLMWEGGVLALLIGLAVIIPLGWWATRCVEAQTGDHDAGYIVIDEVAGLWVALMAAELGHLSILLAFLLFRVFDVLKPWPCSYFDKKLTGPASVMLDDLAAGAYAALCLIGLRYVGLG